LYIVVVVDQLLVVDRLLLVLVDRLLLVLVERRLVVFVFVELAVDGAWLDSIHPPVNCVALVVVG